jgi:hypothetical protein
MPNRHIESNKARKPGGRTVDPELSVRKVAASSVRYGDSISRDGRTVWAAYCGERLVSVGATAGEARRKYYAARAAEKQAGAGRSKDGDLQNLEG